MKPKITHCQRELDDLRRAKSLRESEETKMIQINTVIRIPDYLAMS